MEDSGARQRHRGIFVTTGLPGVSEGRLWQPLHMGRSPSTAGTARGGDATQPGYGWYRSLEGQWRGPEADPTRTSPERPVYQRGWFWTLIVVAVVASAVGQYFLMRDIDRLSRTPISVVYSVTGPAAADITYDTYDTFTNGDESTDEDSTALVPWTMTVKGHRPFGVFTVDLEADNFDPGSTPVTCVISVNGHEVSRHTSVGSFNSNGSVDCSALLS